MISVLLRTNSKKKNRIKLTISLLANFSLSTLRFDIFPSVVEYLPSCCVEGRVRGAPPPPLNPSLWLLHSGPPGDHLLWQAFLIWSIPTTSISPLSTPSSRERVSPLSLHSIRLVHQEGRQWVGHVMGWRGLTLLRASMLFLGFWEKKGKRMGRVSIQL